MPERSNFQNKVIKNYYDQRENIALQRSQEIITELYLSDGKKRQRYWKNLETHLLKPVSYTHLTLPTNREV